MNSNRIISLKGGKAMVSFRIVGHSIFKEKRIVEIVSDDGKVIGTIYPVAEHNAIKVVSTHVSDTTADEGFAGDVIKDDGSKSWPPIPAVFIKFDPSPYIIQGKKIIKAKR